MRTAMVNSNDNRTNGAMQKKRLMNKIREYDFAIVETGLFLDTHPHNLKALKYYSKLREEREKLVAEYERNEGPITIYGNMNHNMWDWIQGPWPWEGDC